MSKESKLSENMFLPTCKLQNDNCCCYLYENIQVPIPDLVMQIICMIIRSIGLFILFKLPVRLCFHADGRLMYVYMHITPD